jgi:hypothetical protein
MKRNGFSVTIVMMVLLCVAGQAEAQYPYVSPVPDVTGTRPNLGSCTCPVSTQECVPPGFECQGTVNQKGATNILSCKIDLAATAKRGRGISCMPEQTEAVVCSRDPSFTCARRTTRVYIGTDCKYNQNLSQCEVVRNPVTVTCNSRVPFNGRDGYVVERSCGPCRDENECKSHKCSVKKKAAAGTSSARPCTRTVSVELSCNFKPDGTKNR